MEFGVSFAAGPEAVQQAQLAEQLGFSSVGYYDSPALGADVWITIANAVQATNRIKVGTEVLVPHLRHPMAQVAAMATIESLAPGRLYVGVGTGFTGRMAMGRPPLSWAVMRRFLETAKALLAGEEVEIDGGMSQMLHPPGFGPARPISIPFWVAANGPKGIEVARELGDGLIYAGDPSTPPSGFSLLMMHANGMVLAQGETASSPRIIEGARIAFPMQYHQAYEGFFGSTAKVEDLPYGDDWLATLERVPENLRHLAVHDRHTVGINDHDAAFIDRHPDALADFITQLVVTPEQLRERISAIQALGATHTTCFAIVGPGWPGAMRAYAEAVGIAQ